MEAARGVIIWSCMERSAEVLTQEDKLWGDSESNPDERDHRLGRFSIYF